jgi:hypothetical protein
VTRLIRGLSALNRVLRAIGDWGAVIRVVRPIRGRNEAIRVVRANRGRSTVTRAINAIPHLRALLGAIHHRGALIGVIGAIGGLTVAIRRSEGAHECFEFVGGLAAAAARRFDRVAEPLEFRERGLLVEWGRRCTVSWHQVQFTPRSRVRQAGRYRRSTSPTEKVIYLR